MEVKTTSPNTEDRDWIAENFGDYLEELSNFIKLGDYTKNESGDWSPDFRGKWYYSEDVSILVFLEGEERLGFAFVCHQPFADVKEGADHRLSEFYILPEKRRSGLAQLAAKNILSLHDGIWEGTVIASNEPAIKLWNKSFEEFEDCTIEELDDGRFIKYTLVSKP